MQVNAKVYSTDSLPIDIIHVLPHFTVTEIQEEGVQNACGKKEHSLSKLSQKTALPSPQLVTAAVLTETGR